MTPSSKHRPTIESEATPEDSASRKIAVPLIIAGLTTPRPDYWPNWLADTHDVPREALGYAVFVCTSSGSYRRRLYLSVESAFRAVQRAQRRGVEAHATLIQLHQVGDVQGGCTSTDGLNPAQSAQSAQSAESGPAVTSWGDRRDGSTDAA